MNTLYSKHPKRTKVTSNSSYLKIARQRLQNKTSISASKDFLITT